MGTSAKAMIRGLVCLLCLGLVSAAPSTKDVKPNAAKGTPAGAGQRRLLSTPATTSISPTYGPMEGNSLVMVVSGGGYSSLSATATKECKFGTSKTTATVINNTHISCRTPKHSTGAATFTLFVANSAKTATATFTFFPTMFVSDFKTSSVLRYNADTGAFFDVFVQPRSGGLDGPWGLAFGLDHNFYVASERTNSVLVYDGSTGAFLKKFCTVKGQPRSMVFHYWDLYVVSAYGDHVYRYKNPTWGLYGGYGSPSTNGGIHATGTYNPASQPTNPQGMGISNGLGEEITANAQHTKLGVNVWKGRFDKVWTNTRVNYANGLDFTVDSLYVVGPYDGHAIVRFNRTTGEYMHHFEDEYLAYPVDIKEFRDYIYVCSEDQVRKYNRLNGEFIKTHSQTDGLLASFLLFHINWNQNLGE